MIYPSRLRQLRSTTAALACLVGVLQVGQLWVYDLTAENAWFAALGGCYLLLGIGLYGVSRFALVSGVGLPALHLWLAMGSVALTRQPILWSLPALAVLIAAGSTYTLWQLHKLSRLRPAVAAPPSR